MPLWSWIPRWSCINRWTRRASQFFTDIELQPGRILSEMERQARSRSDFLEYVKDCEGWKLISEVENKEGDKNPEGDEGDEDDEDAETY